MSLTLIRQLLRTNRKRLGSIFIIISLSLTLFVMITMVVDNVNQQILDETKPLVGADIIIEGSQPLSGEALQYFQSLQNQYSLQTSTTVEFSTNITFTGVDAKLTQVLGVDDTYPLYGEVITTPLPNTESSGVFVDLETYEQFTQDDTIRIGTQLFSIEGIIQELPGTSVNLFDEGRTIIIPYNQVESTQLTQLGSRVEYETHIKTSNDSQTELLLDILRDAPVFEGTYEIENGARRIDQITEITNEFDRFITIVLIITFMLVTTTIFIAVRTFFTNQQQYIGILKLLGQNNRSTLGLYGSLFFSCFVAGWLTACIIGGGAIVLIRSFPLASDFVLYPSARFQAGLIMIILAGISLTLPLSSITSSSPLGLLRPSSSIGNRSILRLQGVVSVIGVLCIYLITLGDILGGILFVIGGTIALACITGPIRLIVTGIVKGFSSLRQSHFMQFDGLRSMIAPGNQTTLMTVGILVTMTALLIISAVSSSFLQQLQSISDDQPSLYVLNIVPEDLPIITNDYPDAIVFDIILSRIQSINGFSLSDHLEMSRTEGGRGGFTREYNVTTAPFDPESYLVGTAPTTGEVSLEQDFAQRLGVELGDQITFFIQGRSFDLEITSFRTIQRDGTGPFFFIQFPQEQFLTAPKSFFWVVDIPIDDKDAFKNSLVEKIGPTLSFVDTDEIIATVTDITGRLITIVRLLVGFLMIFVAVSIIVSLDAMKSLKKQKVYLYGLLGATQKMIKTSLRTEQITIFGIALLLASIVECISVAVIFSFTELLSGSWSIVGESMLIVLGVFLGILGIIHWMYRDLV